MKKSITHHGGAFFLFEKEMTKKIKKQNPKKKEYEISFIIGDMWINSDSTIKIKYYETYNLQNKKCINPIFGK